DYALPVIFLGAA
ncbi:hypothetical protein MK338_10055, partial [Streptococcus vestibularis]|nr:hypothetical protein [Streptococcus vestibularis]